MRYEVASRHRRGKLHQYLVVPADNPDDACLAAYETWDMEDRVITKVRRLNESEIANSRVERQLLTWTTVVIVLVPLAFIAIIVMDYMALRK